MRALIRAGAFITIGDSVYVLPTLVLNHGRVRAALEGTPMTHHHRTPCKWKQTPRRGRPGADQEQAIYCIIKVQEETSSFVSYRPKNDPAGERKIARGRRRVNHYYFFVKDPQFGGATPFASAAMPPFRSRFV
jgi:hypothetical protein